MEQFLKNICQLMIRGYQLLLSPLFGQCCRFYPSCSNYALQAYDKYSIFKASQLTIKRLCRCHPGSDGGVDELP